MKRNSSYAEIPSVSCISVMAVFNLRLIMASDVQGT